MTAVTMISATIDTAAGSLQTNGERARKKDDHGGVRRFCLFAPGSKGGAVCAVRNTFVTARMGDCPGCSTSDRKWIGGSLFSTSSEKPLSFNSPGDGTAGAVVDFLATR